MANCSPNNPTSGEEGGYNRGETPFFWTTRSFSWTWRLATGTVGPFPRARFLVDGSPATDWVASTNGVYPFVMVNVANGHHVASVEFESGSHVPLQKGFVVNDTGAPLPEQTPWTGTNLFEITYGNIKPDCAVAPFTTAAPRNFPLKTRAAVPYTTVLPKTKLWVRHQTANNSARLTRRFATIPTGDVVIAADQKYFYTDATSKGQTTGNAPGLNPPSVTVRDGPRGVGSLGFVYKMIVRRGGKMVYTGETNGRVGCIVLDDLRTPPPGVDMTKSAVQGKQGEIATFAGWRLKKGELKAHAGIRANTYQYANAPQISAHKAHYDSKWEHVGDWSQVPGPHRFKEMWGFAVGYKRPDGSIDNRDGLETWVCDTLHNRILFVNNWTSHPAFYIPAQLAPAGYVSPPAVTGQSQLALFVGTPDQNPSALIDEPFDCEIRPQDKRLYWTNFGNNSISTANLDGSDVRSVLRCALNPTDAELGIPIRLEWGYVETTLRGGISGGAITDTGEVLANAVSINGVGMPAMPAEPLSRQVNGVDTPYTLAQRLQLRATKLATAINTITSSTGVTAVAGVDRVSLKIVDFSRPGITLVSSAPATTGLITRTSKSFVRDGPVGVASCVRPQGIGVNSEGKIIWAERYTYVVRELDLATNMVRTVGVFPVVGRGSSSASTNDISLSIDVEGTCGPKDDILVNAWHDTDLRFSKDGLFRGTWMWTSGANGNNGPLNTNKAPGYSWPVGVGDGHIVSSGNAAGWQFIDITQRLPGDADVDQVKWGHGQAAYHATGEMCLLHGPSGQGELGFPTIEEMGSWDDARLRGYATQWGVSSAPATATYSKLDAFVYFVRCETSDQDYTVAPPPPTPPTITDVTVTPALVAWPGGDITIAATVSNATSVTVDGVQVSLPYTVHVNAAKSFAIVVTGPGGSASAQAQASVETPTIEQRVSALEAWRATFPQ